MMMSLKQRKVKFEPRIKLNHNIYTNSFSLLVFWQLLKIAKLVMFLKADRLPSIRRKNNYFVWIDQF